MQQTRVEIELGTLIPPSTLISVTLPSHPFIVDTGIIEITI